MADSSAEEVTLRLVDAISAPSDAALGSLARLEAQIVREQAALGKLDARMKISGGALSGLKTTSLPGVSKVPGIDAVGDAAKQAKFPLAAVAKSMKLLGGEFGAVESKGVRVVALLGKMGPVIGAVVAGVIVLSGAIFVLGGIVATAISSAGKYRDELLDLSAAGVTFWNGQRANASAGAALQESINRVSSGSALARDKIVEYATSLRNARFKGKELQSTLETMAIVGAGGNDAMAQKFLESAKAAKFFGTGIDKLSERMRLQFGANAARKMLSLDVQLNKLHENISYIFSGADIEPFLGALQAVLSIFNRNEAGATSLRNTVTKFTEAAIGGILDLTIVLLKSYIWLLKHEKTWGAVKLAVKGVVLGIAALGAVAAIALGVIGVAIGLALALIGGLLAAIYSIPAALRSITAAGNRWGAEFQAWWKSLDLSEIGLQMINGLVNGIKGAGGAVLTALKSVVSGAVEGAAKFLGIHSPSKLMEDRIGANMGAGIPQGIEKSAKDVTSATVRVVKGGVDAGADAASGARDSGSTSGGTGRVFNFANCFNGGGHTEDSIRKILSNILDEERMEASLAT